MTQIINPSIKPKNATANNSSPREQLADLIEPADDDHEHLNPNLREQFRSPKREEKRILMKLRNHTDPIVVRNVGIVIAFMIGVSTYIIAQQLELSEKQVRRLILRWNAIGLAAVAAEDEPLPEPSTDGLLEEYEAIQKDYNEQLVELMKNRPTDPVEFLRFEQKTLELRNQMWDKIHQVNVKRIIEDPALIKYAIQQTAKLFPTGWYIYDRQRRKTIERLRRKMADVGKREKAKLLQRIEKLEKQLINKLGLWELDQKATSENLPVTLATGGKIQVSTPYYLLIRKGRGRPPDSRGSSDEGNGIHPVLDLLGFRDKMSLLFCSIVGHHAT